jgi:hypothetical protein
MRITPIEDEAMQFSNPVRSKETVGS